MLLRQEVDRGVEVLSVVGAVEPRDAATLQKAVRRAVELGPRGVLVDLTEAAGLSPEAVDVLNWLTAEAAGWPRPALALCCAPTDIADLLLPQVQVHPGREDALRHVDDRPEQQDIVRAVLDGDPTGPRRARQLAVQTAHEHGLAADDLALVVSELVTNAMRYGTPPVELEIGCCEHCITVVVADGTPGRPAAGDPGPDAEGGRGLLLVEKLASQIGVRPHPPGKAVWAELPRRPASELPLRPAAELGPATA